MVSGTTRISHRHRFYSAAAADDVLAIAALVLLRLGGTPIRVGESMYVDIGARRANPGVWTSNESLPTRVIVAVGDGPGERVVSVTAEDGLPGGVPVGVLRARYQTWCECTARRVGADVENEVKSLR
jgi:hypothetical protein